MAALDQHCFDIAKAAAVKAYPAQAVCESFSKAEKLPDGRTVVTIAFCNTRPRTRTWWLCEKNCESVHEIDFKEASSYVKIELLR